MQSNTTTDMPTFEYTETIDLKKYGFTSVKPNSFEVLKDYVSDLLSFIDKRSFLPISAEAYDFVADHHWWTAPKKIEVKEYSMMNYLFLEHATMEDLNKVLEYCFLKPNILYYSLNTPEEERVYYSEVREIAIYQKTFLIAFRLGGELIDIFFEGGKRLDFDSDYEQEYLDRESGYFNSIGVSRDGKIKLTFLGRWESGVIFKVPQHELLLEKKFSEDHPIMVALGYKSEDPLENESEFFDIDELGL